MAVLRPAVLGILAADLMTVRPATVETIRSHHALRGVAALFVLLFHFRDVTPSIGQAIDARTAFFSTGFIWVDFFFMLSGFILSHVYGTALADDAGPRAKSVLSFYLARFARIYPLHFATLVAMVAVELSAYSFRADIANAFASETKDWWSIVKHLTLTHSWWTMDGLAWNVPSWSISAEAFAYLLLPLLVPMAHHARWTVRALLPLTALAIYMHTFANFSNVENQQPLARCMAGFITGMLLHGAWRYSRERMASSAGPLQFAAVALALVALHRGWNQAWVLIAFACLIVATAGDRGPLARALALRPLLLLGTLSYSLYMTHWIVYRLYWMYGGYLFAGLASQYSPENVYVLKVASLLVLTFAVSWITYQKIELPARWHLRRVLTR